MIATSEDGWIVIYERTMPTDYTTGDIPPGTVVIIDNPASRDERTEAERLAEIVAKAAAEYIAAVAKDEFEESADNAKDWPIEGKPDAGIFGSRKSPIAKARGPPAKPRRSLRGHPMLWRGNGRHPDAGWARRDSRRDGL